MTGNNNNRSSRCNSLAHFLIRPSFVTDTMCSDCPRKTRQFTHAATGSNLHLSCG